MAAEKNFENKVKAFLKDTGAWLLKYWGGAAYTKSGIPDLLVCSDGVSLALKSKHQMVNRHYCSWSTSKKSENQAGMEFCCTPRILNSSKCSLQKNQNLTLGIFPTLKIRSVGK